MSDLRPEARADQRECLFDEVLVIAAILYVQPASLETIHHLNASHLLIKAESGDFSPVPYLETYYKYALKFVDDLSRRIHKVYVLTTFRISRP
jgi:hypothetical protein